jgi:hypothetical protein
VEQEELLSAPKALLLEALQARLLDRGLGVQLVLRLEVLLVMQWVMLFALIMMTAQAVMSTLPSVWIHRWLIYREVYMEAAAAAFAEISVFGTVEHGLISR